MPNGRHQLDCCYCIYFESESEYENADAMYEKGFCKFHKTEIPSTEEKHNQRICIDFEPNKSYEKYIEYTSLTQRFGLFEKKLEENVLYEFEYSAPSEIKKLKDL